MTSSIGRSQSPHISFLQRDAGIKTSRTGLPGAHRFKSAPVSPEIVMVDSQTDHSASGDSRLALEVRIGGLLWIVGAIQFVIAMIVVQLAWTTPYNLAENAISDLGAAHCAENAMGTSYVCSPLHVVFNVSIVLLGILIAAGVVGARSAFPPGRVARAGTIVLVIAGVGATMVGVFPEDVQGVAHSLGALLAFVGAAAALVLFGISMIGDSSWNGYRQLSFACGILSGGTIVASNISEQWGPLGFGGLERLIVAPALLWLVVVGLHFVPRPIRRPTNVISTGT